MDFWKCFCAPIGIVSTAIVFQGFAFSENSIKLLYIVKEILGENFSKHSRVALNRKSENAVPGTLFSNWQSPQGSGNSKQK